MPFTPLLNHPPLPPLLPPLRSACSNLSFTSFHSTIHQTISPVMERKTSTKFLATLFCLSVLGVLAGGDDSIATKCAAEFQKVTQCLPFATAKAAVPSKDCCDSVTDLKESNPACLCYIIQQIHNGTNAAVKSMGVQESRLIQLPSACKLANASVAECPKLLHLPPNSPDAAIFTNANANATTTTPATTPGASSSTSTSTGNGNWLVPQLSEYLIVAMAIFFFHIKS